MTAPQPYSIEEKKDRKENEVQEEQQQESLYERIDDEILELAILNDSLDALSGMMIAVYSESEVSSLAGIINRYSRLIDSSLDRIGEFLTDDMRRAN